MNAVLRATVVVKLKVAAVVVLAIAVAGVAVGAGMRGRVRADGSRERSECRPRTGRRAASRVESNRRSSSGR